MILGFTYAQIAIAVVVGTILIKVLSGSKVKDLLPKKEEDSYDYQKVANAFKTVYDHVTLVGEEEDVEFMDSIAKLVLRSVENDEE